MALTPHSSSSPAHRPVCFGARLSLAMVATAIAVLSLCPRAGHATENADGETPTRLAVVIDAASGVAPWRASALAISIADDIAAYDRLDARGNPEVDVSACDGSRACVLRRYGAAGFDMVMLTTLTEMQARYQLHQTWAPGRSRIGGGTLRTRNSDEHQLRHQLRRLLDPVLRAGGALEKKRAYRGAQPAAAAPVAVDRTRLNQILGLLVIVLALPFLFGWLATRNTDSSAMLRTRTLRWAGAVVVGMSAASYASTVWSDQLAHARWVALIVGGMSWGLFAAAVAQSVFPRFGGLERVEHRDVFRLLRSWSALTLQQAVRVSLFYAPFFVAFWYAYQAVGLPRELALGIAAPVWGLLARFWYACVVENLSLALDRDLITGTGDADDPWHQAVSAYVLGYVKRAGWPADESLLEDVLFQPGTGDQVVLYGGGMTHTRIVIGRGLLEYALAPEGRPHDYAAKRVHKLSWSEWNVGLVVPVELSATVATREQRRPRNPPIPGETEHQPLGQPPTLAGYVEPYQLDRRAQFRPGEDPVWLDWDPNDEYDGTDPSDKDFLFGIIVRELGAMERFENQRRTVSVTIGRLTRRRVPRLQHVTRMITRPLRALRARYPAIVGDAFAALNFSRHHLVQYLAWREWRDESLLTARAYAPELERVSHEILRTLEQTPAGRTPDGAAQRRITDDEDVSPRQRLVWLSKFFHEPVRSRLARRSKQLLAAAVCALVLLALGLGVKQARDYHQTYVEQAEPTPNKEL